MKKAAKVLTQIIVAALAMMVLSSPMAHARPDDGSGNGNGSGSGSTASTCSSVDTADQKYLPMNRWIDGTNDFHTRLDLGVSNVNQIAQNAQRSVQGVMFSTSNALYSTTGSLVGWSNKFCPLSSLGGTVDKASAAVAKGILNSGLTVTLVVLLIFAALFSGLSREQGMGRSNLRKIVTKLIIIGIMAAMMGGASKSTGGGIDGSNAEYEPGTLSPGWVAITIDDVITSIAMTPAVALTSTCDEGSKDVGASGCGIASDPMAGAQLDCGPYRRTLNEMYLADARNKSITSSKYIPGMVVSNMWQITGYRAWTVAQYGDQNGNGWSRVACHQLDIKSNVPAKGNGDMGAWDLAGTNNKNNDLYYSYATTGAVLGQVAGVERKEALSKINGRAPAWRAGESPAELDKALVAWAACMPPGNGGINDIGARQGWKVPAGNEYLIHDGGEREKAAKGESQKFSDACYAFFNEDKNPDGGMFDWGDGDSKINSDAKDAPASVKAFLIALHGNYVSGASGAVLAHGIASLCILIVFGGLAVVQIAIKILMVLMLFFTFIVMMMTLMPNGDTAKLKRYVQQYIGLSLFSAFMILILSIVVLFTGVILQLVSSASGGPTTLMSMLAGGVAPVLSVLGIHFVFKRMGLPSPVTMKGGLGWGAALAGGAGFAAISNGLDSVQNKARAGVSRVGSAFGNKAADGTYRKWTGKGQQDQRGGGDQKGQKGQSGLVANRAGQSSDQTGTKGMLTKDGKPLDLSKRTDEENRREAGAAWAHAVREKAGQRRDQVVGGAKAIGHGAQMAGTGVRRGAALASFAMENRALAGQTIRRGWNARPTLGDIGRAAKANVGGDLRTAGRGIGSAAGWAKRNFSEFAAMPTSEKLSTAGRGIMRTGKRAAIVGGAAALGTGALAMAPVALPGLAAGAGLVAGGSMLAKRLGNSNESGAVRRQQMRDDRINAYREHQHRRGEEAVARREADEQDDAQAMDDTAVMDQENDGRHASTRDDDVNHDDDRATRSHDDRGISSDDGNDRGEAEPAVAKSNEAVGAKPLTWAGQPTPRRARSSGLGDHGRPGLGDGNRRSGLGDK